MTTLLQLVYNKDRIKIQIHNSVLESKKEGRINQEFFLHICSINPCKLELIIHAFDNINYKMIRIKLSILTSRAEHPIWIIEFIKLIKYSVWMLERIFTNDRQILIKYILILPWISLLFCPLYFKSHYSRFVRNYSSNNFLKFRLRWRLNRIIHVLIDNIVANSKKFLPFIKSRY